MKSPVLICLFVSFTLLLVSCSATNTQLPTDGQVIDSQNAQEALAAFLTDLHERKYDEAARLYGGTYATMIEYNPSIDPKEHASLLQNACEVNGQQCLAVKRIGLEQVLSPAEYSFSVEFMNDDGTLFELGPCCGGSATDSPPQSSFIFKVMKDKQDNFKVMDMPPYMP